jgi:hypothetical protein
LLQKEEPVNKNQQWQVMLFISWTLYSISFPSLISTSKFNVWTKFMCIWWLRKGVEKVGLNGHQGSYQSYLDISLIFWAPI